MPKVVPKFSSVRIKLPLWKAVRHLCRLQQVGWTRLMTARSVFFRYYIFATSAVNMEICDPA